MQEDKKQIHIQVRNKIATFVSMNFTLVGGNSDYEVVFDFDSEWAKYPVKTALFIYANETKKVVIDGDTCEGIPIEKATVCLIGAFAGDIYTTTPACIRDIKLSIRDMATSLPDPPTEDVYNQIMELLNRYINEASGLPSGGAKGQVLKKASDEDYDVAWGDEEKGSDVNEEDILRVVKQYIEQNPPKDGFSPTVEIIPIDNGYSVNITDKNGVHNYAIYNGSNGKDGVGISAVEKISSVGNVDTYKMVFTDGRSFTYSVVNGVNGTSVRHEWNGTILTVISASGTSSVDLKGEKGERGEGFYISETYPSVSAMNAGFYTDDVPLNGFVLIETGNVSDEDNAKLFVKTTRGYEYLTDLSGAQGIKGDKGDDGHTPIITIQDGYWYVDGINTNVKAEGRDGNEVTIVSISESSESGGLNVVKFSNGATLTVRNGKDGKDGKTAYEYAKEGGYTGTEQEFAQKLAKELPTKLSELDNDKNFITASGAPVQSINGKTGDVQLSATDVDARPNTWMPTASDVGARPSTWTPTYADVGADKSGEAEIRVSVHNTSPDSHNDIRLLIQGLSDRINAVLDSDDTTLDELSEIVAYIKANKTLIDSITTSKVNVADIVNNLTTNVTNKPLSAAQGVILKGLIDNLTNNKLDASALTSAINTALAQAKASGEFKGEDGKTPYIENGYWYVNGTSTGVKAQGNDYVLTDADKTEIVNSVVAQFTNARGAEF